MKFREVKTLLHHDLKRYTPDTSAKSFLKNMLLNPGFKCTLYYRLCHYFFSNGSNKITNPFYVFSKMMLVRYRYKYGIDIPPETAIGRGLYIGHFGGIFINGQCVIGDYLTISQGVTIGYHRGYPKIGDYVYVAPGAKIFGEITVGDGVSVGANSVVNKDVPANGVVVGIPGRVIALKEKDKEKVIAMY